MYSNSYVLYRKRCVMLLFVAVLLVLFDYELPSAGYQQHSMLANDNITFQLSSAGLAAALFCQLMILSNSFHQLADCQIHLTLAVFRIICHILVLNSCH